MTGLGIIWDITIVISILFIVFLIIGINAGKADAKKAISYLKEIEVTYDKFVTQKIVNSIIKTESLEPDTEKIIQEAITILKPEIEGIVNLVNTSIYRDIKINYESSCFSNITSIIERYFKSSLENEDKKLTKHEVEELYEGFRMAMTSDIKKRMLDYQ